MYLWVTPSGGKLWRWAYVFKGKEKLMALGRYPDVSLAAAREQHGAARKLLASSVDPMAERKAAKQAMRIAEEHSFAHVAAQWIDLWIDLPIERARTSSALWRVLMQEDNGGTRVQCSRDNLDFFAGMLLTTRRRVVVYEPAALRDTLRELGKEATVAAKVPRTKRPLSSPVMSHCRK